MKRVLITGAASGFGIATAAALRELGCDVAGIDLQPGVGIDVADVRDQAAVDAAVQRAVARLGGLDVLINCAGVGDPQPASGPPGPDALRVLDVNLLGTWRVTAAALPALRQSRGRVVNVASGLAHFSLPYATAYCASKRGVVAYSDALRLELGGEVGVTTIYPGYVRTPIHDASRRLGLALEGRFPAEPIEAVVRTLVKAVFARRPRRDLATSRRGAVAYLLLRWMGPGLMDRVIRRSLSRQPLRPTLTKPLV